MDQSTQNVENVDKAIYNYSQDERADKNLNGHFCDTDSKTSGVTMLL